MMSEPLCVTFKSMGSGLTTKDVNFYRGTLERLVALDAAETTDCAIEKAGRERWGNDTISWEIMGNSKKIGELLQLVFRDTSSHFQRIGNPVETEFGPATQFLIQHFDH